MNERFRKIALKIAELVGSPWNFLLWLLLVCVWFISGFYLHFNEAWNFWANTTTTILTFLIALLLQNTQNRSNKEIQMKLDEIIRSIENAENNFIDLESLSDKELRELEVNLKKHRSKKI